MNFRNLSTIHDYYRADLFGDKYPKKSSMDSAPIIWIGGSDSIVNCTFIDNIGYSGGSILWSGNNGYIGHNKFINNHVRCLGGFAYIEGTNVTISDNLVANCEARFDGDALYVKNFSSCIVDHMNFIKVNDTNSSFVAPDIVDGALMDVDSRVCFPSYMTFSYTVVDTFPILYGKKISAVITFILIIMDCILCPLLYFQHIFNILYLIIIAIAVILFIYSGILIIKNQDVETAAKVSKFLKIGMLIAFVSFAVGSF